MEKFILTNNKRKKAQVWGFDLMIAITIFVIGIIAIYIYAINFTSETESNLEALFSQGNLVSSLILSEGTPKDWIPENVEIPGILTNNKINQTKLDNFYSLNYETQKNLLGTNLEFYFSFFNMKISGQTIEGIGKKPEQQKNLVRIERFSIYENKPVKLTFYIWD